MSDEPWALHDDTNGGLENDTEPYDLFQSVNVVVADNIDKDTNGTEQIKGNEKTVDEPNKKKEKLLTGGVMKLLSEEGQQEPVKIELTEKITQTLPGNKTREVLVNEKEEKLSSGETIKEVSITKKNVTDKDLNITDIEEETLIAQKVAKGASHLVKGEEKSTEKVVSAETEEKGLGTVFPSGNEEIPVEKVVPSAGEQNVQQGKERVAEKTAPSLEETLKANLTEKLPEFEKEKIVPSGSVSKTITKKDIVTEEKAGEKNGSENTGENIAKKVIQSIKQEEEKVVPLRKDIEGVAGNSTPAIKYSETKGNVTEPVTVGEVMKGESLGNETFSPVPREGEREYTTSKRDIVTGEKVTDQDGFNITEEKAVETVAPSTAEKEEKGVMVSKGEEIVENITPGVTENATEGNMSEKAPIVQEVSSAVNETMHSVPRGEENGSKTMAKKEIVTQEKLTTKNASIIKEENAEKVAPSVKESEEKVILIPKKEGRVIEKMVPAVKENVTKGNVTENVPLVQVITCIASPVNEMVRAVPKGEKEENKTAANREIVAMEKVINKREKVVEKAAPSAKGKEEKVVPVLKGEIAGNKTDVVTGNTAAGNISENVPVVQEGKTVVWPFNETVSSVPYGKEKENQTREEREIVTEKKVIDKDGSVIKEENVVEEVVSSVKEKDEKDVPIKTESLIKEI